MAHSNQSESEQVMVIWDKMRNFWVYSAGQISREKAGDVKAYFNKFVANNPEFSFTITQLYDELFQICITTDQYLDIKKKLEKKLKIELPDVRAHELFAGGSSTKKKFQNTNDFRQLREHGLAVLNKPIIRRKHQEAQRHFGKVKNAFNSQDRNDFLAFDIEVYEHDHTQVLEIGYIIVRFSPARYHTRSNLPNLEVTTRRHLIIKDNLHYQNKDKVPDNRYGFKFGVSETMPMDRAVEKFREDISECDYLLGHSVHHDEAYLKEIGVDLSELGKELFDTQVVQTYKESLKNGEKYCMRGLENLLKEYEVNYEESHLHNAGCDAFYTMMVFLRQMGYTAEQVNDIIASYKSYKERTM